MKSVRVEMKVFSILISFFVLNSSAEAPNCLENKIESLILNEDLQKKYTRMQVIFDLGTALREFTMKVGVNTDVLLNALMSEEFIQSFAGDLELALPFITQQCAVIAHNFDNIFISKVFLKKFDF